MIVNNLSWDFSGNIPFWVTRAHKNVISKLSVCMPNVCMLAYLHTALESWCCFKVTWPDTSDSLRLIHFGFLIQKMPSSRASQYLGIIIGDSLIQLFIAWLIWCSLFHHGRHEPQREICGSQSAVECRTLWPPSREVPRDADRRSKHSLRHRWDGNYGQR